MNSIRITRDGLRASMIAHSLGIHSTVASEVQAARWRAQVDRAVDRYQGYRWASRVHRAARPDPQHRLESRCEPGSMTGQVSQERR
jgi:hypothetical protein